MPFLAAPVYGQSLGDIARQERARKQSEARETTHVYDNDDLARPQILQPQDRAGTAAATQDATPPAAPAAPSANGDASAGARASTDSAADANTGADQNTDMNAQPLGDIARHYRALKAARQEQASQAANADPDVSARTNANAGSKLDSKTDSNVDPSVDTNSTPLGDIARYYRALKAARQKQESQSVAQHSLPAAAPLAYPTFTQPPVHLVVPPAPLEAASAGTQPGIPTRLSAPTQRPRDSTSREVERIGGAERLRVHSGDTLWQLARRYLGRGKDWVRLAASNPQVTDPKRLQVGSRLLLPDTGNVSATPGSLQPTRVRVEGGDSLWKLSRLHFGDGKAWRCVAEANPEVENANLIFPGQVLRIPSICVAGWSPQIRGPAVSADSILSRSAQPPTPAL